jgi:hypothetical protein
MAELGNYIQAKCGDIVRDIIPLLCAPVKKQWIQWVNELNRHGVSVLRRELNTTPTSDPYADELSRDKLAETPMTIKEFCRSFRWFAKPVGAIPPDFDIEFGFAIRNYYLAREPDGWDLLDYIRYHFPSVKIHLLQNDPETRTWTDWVNELDGGPKRGIFIRDRRSDSSMGEMTILEFLRSFRLELSDTLYRYHPEDFDDAFKSLIRKYLFVPVSEPPSSPPKQLSWTLKEYVEDVASTCTREDIQKIVTYSGSKSWDDWVKELDPAKLLLQSKQRVHDKDDKIDVYSFFASFRLIPSELYLRYNSEEFDFEFRGMVVKYFAKNPLPDHFAVRVYTTCVKLGLDYNTVVKKLYRDRLNTETQDEWNERLLPMFTANGSRTSMNIEAYLRVTEDLMTALQNYATDQPSIKRMRILKEKEDEKEFLVRYRKSYLDLLPREVLESGFFDYSAYRSERHIRDEINLGIRSYCVAMLANTHTPGEIVDALYSFVRSMPWRTYQALYQFFDQTIGRNQDKDAIEYAIKALHYVIMTSDEDLTEIVYRCDGTPVVKHIGAHPNTETHLQKLLEEYRLLSVPITPPAVSHTSTPPATPPPAVSHTPTPPATPPSAVTTTPAPPATPPPAVSHTPSSPPPAAPTSPSALNPASQQPHAAVPQHAYLDEYKKRFEYLDTKGYQRTKKWLEMNQYTAESLDHEPSEARIIEVSNRMINMMKTALKYKKTARVIFDNLAAQYEGFDKLIDDKQLDAIEAAYKESVKSDVIKKLYESIKAIHKAQSNTEYEKAMQTGKRQALLARLGTLEVDGEPANLFPMGYAVRRYLEINKATN